jgi:hypothetical protein
MPVIKEQDLLDLYSELESLKVDNDKLHTGFNDLRLNANKREQRDKKTKIIFVFVVIALIISLTFMYFKTSDSKYAIKEVKERNVGLRDSVQKLKQLIPFKKNIKVLYSVQLGFFKTLNIDFSEAENLNLKKLETTEGTGYLIGDFLSYRTATTFKNRIKKIGFKDAFLVPYDKDYNVIDIKEALNLSKEE